MNLIKSKNRKFLILLLIFISVLPFFALFFIDVLGNSFVYKLANITGFVGAVLLIWQFVLGIRGFSKKLTQDYDWVIKIHTFLGINGALFVLLHPILESLIYEEDIRFFYELNFSSTFNAYLSLGKIAFGLFLIIWLTSGLLRKALKYRSWLYIHYLSYPMLIALIFHPLQIGSILQSNNYVYFYWIFLMLVSFVALIIKILDVLNISYRKFKVTEILEFPGNIFTIKYKPLFKNKIEIKPGQYFYIKRNFIGESHPFSVLEYNEESGEITFGIKKLGKYSSYLATSSVSDTHYIDGPFGEFTYEGHNDSPKIFLAGGIGITPFYENIKQFGDENTYLFYANKNISEAFYRDNFKKILGKNYYDFVIEHQGTLNNVFCEFISSKRIKELLGKEKLSNFKFFICGSPVFTRSMISCIKELGVDSNNIYIEEFEY